MHINVSSINLTLGDLTNNTMKKDPNKLKESQEEIAQNIWNLNETEEFSFLSGTYMSKWKA